jgi:DNA invertase Pin-like site-specific DNA recombinase
MARIGYLRVSTAEQNLDRQEDALQTLNLDRVFSDKQSGRTTDRPGLQNMLDFLREGDVLYVESISRLARSTRDLLSIVESLDQKGIGFVSLKEQIDTGSPQGKFVMTLFGALAELERATIRERQREGIKAAQARGRSLGRPRAEYPAEWERVYNDWKAGRITAAATMKALSLRRTTFYKLVRGWQSLHCDRSPDQGYSSFSISSK